MFSDQTGGYYTFAVPGALGTIARDINDSGQIVGSYSEIGGPNTFVHRLYGFLYDNLYEKGAYSKIEYPGAFFTWANGINDRDPLVASAGYDIVGTYYREDEGYDHRHGFLATTPPPVKE